MAEAYHTQVVAAHKRHSRVDLPLPVLAGSHFGPEQVAAQADRSSTDDD